MAKSPAPAIATETPALATDENVIAITGRLKRTRSPSGPKTLYAVVRLFDEDGEVVTNAKGRIEVLSFERSAEKVLEVVDSGKYPGALYLRGVLPAQDPKAK